MSQRPWWYSNQVCHPCRGHSPYPSVGVPGTWEASGDSGTHKFRGPSEGKAAGENIELVALVWELFHFELFFNPHHVGSLWLRHVLLLGSSWYFSITVHNLNKRLKLTPMKHPMTPLLPLVHQVRTPHLLLMIHRCARTSSTFAICLLWPLFRRFCDWHVAHWFPRKSFRTAAALSLRVPILRKWKHPHRLLTFCW
jgi:hypothetical protein